MIPQRSIPSEHPAFDGCVLIIDDDELIAASLRHVLTGRGFDVDLARNRQFAEDLLVSRTYRVVVVDPYFTGEVHHGGTLLPVIRKLQPEAAMVVLSAYGISDVVSAPTLRTTIVRKPQPIPFLSSLVTALLRNPTDTHTAPAGSEMNIREVES